MSPSLTTIMNAVNLAYKTSEDWIAAAASRSGSLFGVFAYGSMNTGLYIHNVSDIDCYAVYVPTIEEGLMQTHRVSTTFEYPYGQITIKDIREFMKMINKASINFLQCLFTPYAKVNSKYSQLWDLRIIANNERIAYNNPYTTCHATIGHLQHNMSDSMKNGIVIEDSYARTKMWCNIMQLINFMEKYLNGNTLFVRCLPAPSGIRTIKKDGVDDLNFDALLRYGEDIIHELREVMDRRYSPGYINEALADKVEHFAYEIIMMEGKQYVCRN